VLIRDHHNTANRQTADHLHQQPRYTPLPSVGVLLDISSDLLGHCSRMYEDGTKIDDSQNRSGSAAIDGTGNIPRMKTSPATIMERSRFGLRKVLGRINNELVRDDAI
jgi:hypothetical protein